MLNVLYEFMLPIKMVTWFVNIYENMYMYTHEATHQIYNGKIYNLLLAMCWGNSDNKISSVSYTIMNYIDFSPQIHVHWNL